MKTLFRVLIIGRTNVGKSTFFSRITEIPAVISNEENTTRDARESLVEWNKGSFMLIDTGGFDIASTDPYEKAVTATIEEELKRTDLVLLMTDMIDPLPVEEQKWIRRLMSHNQKMIVVSNKNDKPNMRRDASGKTYKGIPVFTISSKNGGGVGDLLDAIIEFIPEKKNAEYKQTTFRLGLVGRTNVGKSSLLNVLAGEPKAIVSDAHHTTREPIAVQIPFGDQIIEVIDTAGAQKNPKKDVARKSTQMTKDVIQSCDVVALVLEFGANPIPSQDLELADLIADSRKSLFIIINKWDQAQEQTHVEAQKEIKRIKGVFKSFSFAPVIVTSAIKKIHIKEILQNARAIQKERIHKLDKKTMRAIVATLSEHMSHLTQTEVDPPHFHAIATSRTIPRAMTDILRKKIRAVHAYTGTPIIVSLAKRSRRNETRSRAR